MLKFVLNSPIAIVANWVPSNSTVKGYFNISLCLVFYSVITTKVDNSIVCQKTIKSHHKDNMRSRINLKK